MITITKMLPEHRGCIFEILQQTDMFTMSEIDVAMELVDTYLFNKDQKDYIIYIALTREDVVAGYICYGPTPATEGTYDIYWIAVSPTMQNRGIGKQLLFYVEGKIIQDKGRLIVIETSSIEKYISTQKFYLNVDYSIAARIKDFYRPKDDRLILVKYIHS